MAPATTAHDQSCRAACRFVSSRPPRKQARNEEEAVGPLGSSQYPRLFSMSVTPPPPPRPRALSVLNAPDFCAALVSLKYLGPLDSVRGLLQRRHVIHPAGRSAPGPDKVEGADPGRAEEGLCPQRACFPDLYTHQEGARACCLRSYV